MDITSHNWRSLSPGQSICFDDVPHSLLAGDAAHILPENKFTMRFRIIPVSQVHKSDKNLRTIFVTCWRIIFCLKVYLLSLYTLTSRNSFEFKYLLQFTYSLHEKSMMSLVAMKICQFKFFIYCVCSAVLPVLVYLYLQSRCVIIVYVWCCTIMFYRNIFMLFYNTLFTAFCYRECSSLISTFLNLTISLLFSIFAS